MCDWEFQDDTSDEVTTVRGVLLGFGTSHRTVHNHADPRAEARARAIARHPATGPAPSVGGACSACRWFEVTIVRDGQTYYVSFVGRTSIPGEVDRHSLHVTESAHTIIEVLTQHRDGNMFIPRTSRIALSEAAGRDERVEAAWIDRAV